MYAANRNRLSKAVALTITLACAASAFALPDDMTVSYRFHENPKEETSITSFEVILHLTAVEVEGQDVAWEIIRADFKDVEGASNTRQWSDANAIPETVDGLWWVTHSDPERPLRSEFKTVPLIWGTATADKPSDSNLMYDLDGFLCDDTCETMYAGNVTQMTWSFATEDDGDEPIDEGEEEPVELPNDA